MHDKKVAVAMSGGVDSSVAAAFLKNKGFNVFGVTLTLGYDNSKDVSDARSVAKMLDIPHHVISLEKAFDKNVISYFIQEYHRGKTPNPCAVCNPTIKFGLLLDKVIEMGAELIATGHYAVISYSAEKKRYLLKKGVEAGKDQSYFLSRLSQDSLSKTLFPVGTYKKNKIRELAEKFGIHVAEKKESQEVCFIKNESVLEFIKRRSDKKLKPGKIVDTKGNILAEHEGIENFTIGQRKGLGIAMGKPVYVIEIHGDTGEIVIGDNPDLYKNKFLCTDPNWISINKPDKALRVEAKIRYMHKPKPATILLKDDQNIIVEFDTPQRAITPGQLAVFYDKKIVVGSAWIDRVF
ncbi:tRNA 2-thiouridine(34) synthase MnmA [candidate division KSB1 bacterium]|nr:MAG: tRNA 2-thiouridine(34) synthase MnmA [candidate division KSB1 bacterium]